ncbi:MAG: NUDIX hydrolase [Myxococcota bacterium]
MSGGDDGGWQRRSSRMLFESPWFRLRQDEVTLPGGDDITYTLVDHEGYVVVVPVTDAGDVVMERIYRYTVQRTLLECPSGGLDGEDPETAGLRELEEETGYRAASVERLGSFFGSTGISNERYHVCLATGLRRDGTIRRENTEQMEIELHPLATLRARAVRGEIEDAASAFAILLAAERLAS